ncbi:single-stranded DNA-binding protein [Bacillus alkalicellulosilyticus]|uniref:single-stranded DNA-binding protein n=1 Tax=Alkalihalobacterium alkalicellulosilyticum TaxID=1912214 RepID=UPI0009983099|nr:single-stranded DNA-binding protein [Bacillus alkalicellulosilyticus]
MGDINRCIVSGRLVKNPTLYYIERNNEQVAVCQFSIASDRGHRKNPNYIDIVVWREYGESCANHLVAGQEVTVDGKIVTRFRIDNGKNIKITELHAEEVKFGQKPKNESK